MKSGKFLKLQEFFFFFFFFYLHDLDFQKY